ncbi:MAG TPA: hypothetical protein VIL68_13525 [Propionibacteriaceae bacterium]
MTVLGWHVPSGREVGLRSWLWGHAQVVEFVWINSRLHDRASMRLGEDRGCTRLCAILWWIVDALYVPPEP